MTNKTDVVPTSRGLQCSGGTAPQTHDTALKEKCSTMTDKTKGRDTARSERCF